MIWKISVLPKTETDLSWFRRHNKSYYAKSFDIIRDIIEDPRRGIGKPERLRYFDREVWSRRISSEHRLIYVVYKDENCVEVVSCRSHYEGIKDAVLS
ncbi:MAG: Txe/YoeB family addiction module toxin [Planctomycetes bacterium]|nr:Txe/YoeB family addiction module toxin [Planctomycetota bacterium]